MVRSVSLELLRGDAMRLLPGVVGVLLFAQSVGSALGADFVWTPKSGTSGLGSLYLIGQITPGDYGRFVAAIKGRGAAPFVLYVRSQGGNVYEAMKVGRLVRQLSLTVDGPLSSPENINQASCLYDEKTLGRQVPCICASACTLIFFGGVFRVGLEIYVHSIAYEKNMLGALTSMEAAEKYRQAMTEVRAYLTEMDVPDKYYYMMTETGSSDLTRVPLPFGGSDIAGWTPAYREWLFAKCGNSPGRPITTASAAAWGNCTVNAENEAIVDAIKKYVLTQE